MKKFIFACTLLLVFACASTMNYVPKQFQSVSEAKLTIKRFLKEQPPEFVPYNIEITTDCLKTENYLIRGSVLAAGITTVPTITYVCYSNIGDIKLYFKKGIYRIFVFDKDSSVVRSKYYSSNESKAKKFIDALYTLKMDFGNP